MQNKRRCMSEKQSSSSFQKQPEARAEMRRRLLIGDAETATEAVVAAVANADNAEVESLPPLGDKLDTEALNRLVGSETQSPAASLHSLGGPHVRYRSFVRVRELGCVDLEQLRPAGIARPRPSICKIEV
jgi:hypothetical protein